MRQMRVSRSHKHSDGLYRLPLIIYLQNGNTPLHLACQNNEVDTVEILINKGVDLNCLNLVSKIYILFTGIAI